MLWVMTGYSSRREGLAFVIESETEQGAYEAVAEICKMKHVRVEHDDFKPESVKTGEGLDDKDLFDNHRPYHLMLPVASSYVPNYADLEMGDDFTGFVCIACPLEIGVNLGDIVQW